MQDPAPVRRLWAAQFAKNLAILLRGKGKVEVQDLIRRTHIALNPTTTNQNYLRHMSTLADVAAQAIENLRASGKPLSEDQEILLIVLNGVVQELGEYLD